LRTLLSIPTIVILIWSLWMLLAGHPIALLGFTGYLFVRSGVYEIYTKLIMKRSGNLDVAQTLAIFTGFLVYLFIGLGMLSVTKSSEEVWRYSQFGGVIGGLLGWVSSHH